MATGDMSPARFACRLSQLKASIGKHLSRKIYPLRNAGSRGKPKQRRKFEFEIKGKYEWEDKK